MERKKILIIDDEEDLCRLMKLNLESDGRLEVAIAFSGQEGIGKVNKEAFDLVITDFDMPDMNGNEVIDALKQINSSLPVLLFSVYHDDVSTLLPSIKNKANGIINKPIDHSQLHKLIKDALYQDKESS